MKFLFLMCLLLPIFSYGQRSFKSGDKYGFKTGDEIIIAAEYEYASDFSDGLACVKKCGKWGYINNKNIWISQSYDKIQPIINGYGKVMNNGKFGLVDSNGVEVFAAEYKAIKIRHGIISPENESGIGLMAYSISIPCRYQYTIVISKSFACGKRDDGKYDIYDNEGIMLEGQETYFLRRDIMSGSNVIATKKGKYGLFNIASKKWVLKPKYAFISSLYCAEFNDGSLSKSKTAYFVFSKLNEEITYSLKRETEAENKITVLQTSSLKPILKSISGYKKVEHYDDNKDEYNYDFEIKVKGLKEIVMLNVLLKELK